MEIRPAGPADAEAVAAIYGHYVETSPATFAETAPSKQDIAEQIEAARLPFLVAELDGTVEGYAYLAPYKERSAYRFTAEVSVYVAHGARRRGIGRALIEALLPRAEAAGLRELIAIIAVSDDPSSVKLLEGFGFVEAGRLTAVGYKLERWYDTVLLQRSLSPAPSAGG